MHALLRNLLLLSVLPMLALSTPGLSSAEGPSLIDQLVQQTGVSTTQAEGGAGAVFNLAKERLQPEQFSKVASAVPDMGALLQAAPKKSSGMSGMLGGASSLLGGMSGNTVGGLASLTGAFSQLGLAPNMIGQFVPIIQGFVAGNGGSAVGGLLDSVLK